MDYVLLNLGSVKRRRRKVFFGNECLKWTQKTSDTSRTSFLCFFRDSQVLVTDVNTHPITV